MHPCNGTYIKISVLFQSLAMSQGVLVMITAISAFATVVLNKIITYGKCDYVLLLATFGIPIILTTVLAGLDWLGPSGFW